MRYAEVAVNAPSARPRTFTYALPSNLPASVGCAVWVPFGKRQLQGVIFAFTEYPTVEEIKEITEVIAPEPLLFPYQLELARWISEYYFSPLFEATALMLPPGFEQRVLTFLQPIPNPSEETLSSLTPQQRRVFRFVERKGKVEQRELKKVVPQKRVDNLVKQLIRKNLLRKTLELEKPRIRPKMISYLRLTVDPEQAKRESASLEKRGASRQAELLKFLLAEGSSVPLTEANKRLGSASSVAQSLKKKGLISIERIRVQRDPLAYRTFERTTPPQLTPAQEKVWARIQASLQGLASGKKGQNNLSRVFLLHGVTGSGKTEIYLRALEQAISLGKKAIVLVPEIALTPQTVSRFASRFPGKVAVLHSKLSPGEQFDEWQRIREGEFDVVIGSRSAIFAPQPDLGLIVIDEEHEWTYKQQDKSPRYHAREVALKLAELTGAVVILGSATPDVESYYRAQLSQYELLELPERVGGGQPGLQPEMPQVEIVDLRKELREGNRSIFSRKLTQAINEALNSGEQVILFLNRRGSASFVQCRNCGYVMRCRRCQTTLTYHAQEGELICHQCNYRIPPPKLCPECWSRRIKFLGIGTQKVEEETHRAFPKARLLRWDRDVTKGRYSHEQILEKFLSHEADILIGTQMIAKGLDIPLVTLVGVINADIGLHLPDFRAGERTFQLLSQVAGRAGRGERGGRVIVQTYSPGHYAITAAARQDFRSFYTQEIAFRRQLGNPPFSRLIRLIYTHTNAEVCRKRAEKLAQLLREERDSQGLAETTLLGPSPAYIERVRGRYRWQIIIRGSNPAALLSQVPLPQGWIVDVDPVGLA